jgi:hypothetical protein
MSEGIRKLGNYLYVTADTGGLSIFDTRKPEQPKRVGLLPLPHAFENEDVDTDGRILLLSQASVPTMAEKQAARKASGVQGDVSLLHVVDVSNKTKPRILATLPGAGDHTISCLLHCTWAYGASGYIVDLRDPVHPRISDNSWLAPAGLDGTPAPAHDLVEIDDGIMLAASIPMQLLDARHDPEHPKLLAISEGSTQSFHNAYWPDAGRSPIVLSAAEAYINPRCETRDAAKDTPASTASVVGYSSIQSWDASGWAKTGRFRPLHSYAVRNGTWLDGDPAVSQNGLAGCSQHYFDPHPAFGDGGWISAASYGHGVKFLRVGRTGEFTEVGWFLPAGAASLAAIWVTDQIVYAVDVHRGIDVLRVTDAPRADGRAQSQHAWRTDAAPTAADVRRLFVPGVWTCFVGRAV